jgi:hypothetical protein
VDTRSGTADPESRVAYDDIKQSEPRLNERKPQRGAHAEASRGALGRVRTQLAKTTGRLLLNVPLFVSNFMYGYGIRYILFALAAGACIVGAMFP